MWTGNRPVRYYFHILFLNIFDKKLLGNVYIAGNYNHRIRKVTVSTGIISTIAGDGNSGYSGDNGAASSASLYFPVGVALDSSGTTPTLLVALLLPVYFTIDCS